MIDMQTDLAYLRLLQRTGLALLACACLVAFCYFFVDRPVAFFVHDQHAEYRDLFDGWLMLEWLTLPPPILQAWSPALLAVLLVRRCWGPFTHAEWTLFAAAVAIVMADQARESLSFLFGRYWPDTWINNNPSLIKNNAYGFHPFHSGEAYGSFPSGHTARSVAVAAVIWVAWPGYRWLGVLFAALVVVGLVGMNYHFVGDVVGGSFVGGIVGVYAAALCELADHDKPSR